jgi:hypothetical protein
MAGPVKKDKYTPMKKLILSILLLSYSCVIFAQNMDYARKVVKTLASPAFKGRGYAENGDQIASAFIAGEFKKSGLLPLNGNSYFQDFDLSVNTFPGDVKVELNGKTLITGADYLVEASSPPVQGHFQVITADRTSLNSVEKVLALVEKAKDAFILLNDQVKPSEEGPEEKRMISQAIEALKYDENLEFKGLIVCTSDKLTWTTLSFQTTRPVIVVNKKGLDPESIQNITLNIESRFIPKYTTRNVVGMLKGTSGSDSTLVISAHFDHLGLMGNKVYFPGANDNASGTAMLLSFVKEYARHPPKYNTVFLAFSGEEIGLLGSKAFVEHPLTDLKKIKFLVNFDLAGTGEEGIKVVNGSIFKAQFDRLTKLNQQDHLLPKVEIRGAACISDHCRFYEKGVPSFFIYTQGGIKAYHDIYDRSETLPLTEFSHYFQLMQRFFAGF